MPSNRIIIKAATSNCIRIMPIAKREVLLTEDVLGPSIHAIKGKTTRKQPDLIDSKRQLAEVPKSVKDYYSSRDLSGDVMNMNSASFLTNISDDIHCRNIGAVNNLQYLSLEHELKKVVRSHTVHGFRIVVILLYIQFKAIKDRNLVGVPINIVAIDEYVLLIELFHRVIKKIVEYILL